MNVTCTCGRVGEHCPNTGCGSVNKWPMIQRSLIVSKQLGRDVRFYRCRKCGTEYGYLGNTLFDAECNAPEESRLKQKHMEPEDEVRLIKEAIALLESKGLKVSLGDKSERENREESKDIPEEIGPVPSLSFEEMMAKTEEDNKDE